MFSRAQSFMIAPYKVFYLLNARETFPLQAGFAASSRVFKKATDRNRVKRLTKEAFRLEKMDLIKRLEGHQLGMQVFFVFTGKELPEFQQVKKKMYLILQRLTHVVDEKAALHP